MAIMSISIGRYNFNDPVTQVDHLLSQSGVYTILGRNGGNQRWTVVDIGESADVRARVANHDRIDQWRRCGHTIFAAAALYVGERERMVVERELRILYNPPCGKH
jgi:hypothetical protein